MTVSHLSFFSTRTYSVGVWQIQDGKGRLAQARMMAESLLGNS